MQEKVFFSQKFCGRLQVGFITQCTHVYFPELCYINQPNPVPGNGKNITYTRLFASRNKPS
jgi:hypothetical protein